MAKQEYDDLLNFSSEIEFDERFDLDKFNTQTRPDHLLDRSQPMDRRMSAIAMLKDNRKQLFQAYRIQLADEKKALMAGANYEEFKEEKKNQ